MSLTVNVVIPCYNQGRFLADALASLQAQSYPDWEAIIVDDGSLDDTAAIAARLCRDDGRVRYLAQANGGLSSARNTGIRNCRGAFVQFLDSDDRLDARKFEVHVRVLRDQPETAIVYGNARYFVEGSFGQFNRGPYAKGPSHNWIADAWADSRPILNKLVERNLFPVCAPLLRRAVFDRVGLFNEKLEALEDWEYWLRCAAAGMQFRFVEVEGTDALIQIHTASMTQNLDWIQHAICRMRTLCHGWLPPGEARNVNLEHLLVACAALGQEGRNDRYAHVSKLCHSWNERALVRARELCEIGGPLHGVASRLGRCLPERLRHKLACMGVDFGPRA